jgi:hypothetical protein
MNSEDNIPEPSEDLLVTFNAKEKRWLSTRTRWILMVSIILIAVADILIIVETIPYFSDSYFPNTTFAVLYFAVLFLIVTPVASFILALILSLFVLKKKAYAQRYIPLTLIISLVGQLIFLVFSVIDYIKYAL